MSIFISGSLKSCERISFNFCSRIGDLGASLKPNLQKGEEEDALIATIYSTYALERIFYSRKYHNLDLKRTLVFQNTLVGPRFSWHIFEACKLVFLKSPIGKIREREDRGG